MANAQATLADNSGLGDMAIVPYYTTNANYATGVDIVNTSALTQVVKIRLRRATDSMDALDFIVVLSPEDVWTGYIQKDGATTGVDPATIRFYSNDNSCTAPAMEAGGYFTMPDIYRLGAGEGYIEVIGMGAADSSQPISRDALHNSEGVPFACDRVRDNFRWGDNPADYGVNADPNRRGVISSVETRSWSTLATQTLVTSNYTDTGNVLKVSYFIKSDETGFEFGNNAVHFADFMDGASITNQKLGIFEGDLQGFDHPDLNGGAPFSATVEPTVGAAARGAYEPVRTAIGARAIVNDWSKKQTELFSVDTDWVVTTPGQYLMTNLGAYLASIVPGSPTTCGAGDPAVAYNIVTGANCDFRDIPMVARFKVLDREEQGIIIDEGDLVVSPQPPGEQVIDVLDQEVNVIVWGESDVLVPAKRISVPTPADSEFGWSKLEVTQSAIKTQAICDFTDLGSPLPVTCTATDTPVPLVGFVAWQRNFANLAEANYGRLVEHSYIVSSAP
ncbi:MAG: hypothetical protein DRR04_06300 [Gammaproteobacteria bacterium]|nr:MAG: hypothetical protein DRR04_06300 [Gammaproteobacteria bacterium]